MKSLYHGQERVDFQRRWPRRFLVTECVLAAVLTGSTLAWAPQRAHWIRPFAILVAVSFSSFRIAEIFYAFYFDAMDKLEPEAHIACARCTAYQTPDSDKERLTKGDRIRLVIQSYLSLIINWAFIYFALPVSQFQVEQTTSNLPAYEFQSFVDAIYFSAMTIATVGYGDIHPSGNCSKFLCICEVGSGMLILLVALAAYLARGNSETMPKCDATNNSRSN
jgi:hypothetical protein